MSEEKQVWLVRPKGRPYQIRWLDPETGKTKSKSAKTNRRREAERKAGKLEADLLAGKLSTNRKISWQDFRQRYEDDYVSGLADRTGGMVFSILGIVERICNPQKLTDLTAARIVAFQAKLRVEGKSEATIGAYSRHLKAALRWAVEIGMLQKAPKIRMPKRAKGAKAMKGRPINQEEYERLLMAVPKVVGEESAASWKYYLEGLWWSGLRLAESLDLYWDRQDKLSVDLTGRRPMLRIPAELEKGNRNRQLAMAPEFAKFLERTPPEDRKGRVFSLRGSKGSLLEAGTVSKRVCEIGHKAGVKVEETKRMGQDHVKYASCHDLRRSFGERWSTRVMPQVLMELMRHESIETTMKYYVGRNAERTADALWAAVEEKPLRANLRASDDLEQIDDDCKSKKTSCFQASN